MSRLMALIVKEFQALLKDPRSRFVIIGPPIIQLLVFGYAATFDVTHVPIAVYNESTSAGARDLVAKFIGSPNFSCVEFLHNDRQIAPLINQRKVLGVLRIGPQFGRDLNTDGAASIQFIVDGRDSNTALITVGYARVIVNNFNAEWLKSRGITNSSARLEVRSWFNPNLQSRWFIVPGIVGLLTLVVTLIVTSLSVAREREQGTFDQLLVTPYQPWEILIGKSIPGFIIGMVEATFIVTMAVLWFHVPLIGSLLTLYVGLAMFVIAAIGVGLMISSLAVTQQQALLGAFLFLVPAIILSGFSTPISNMPYFIQQLTYINPMRYIMVVLRSVFLQATPFEMMVNQFWPMAVIGLVSLTSAAWLFRRRMY